MAKPGQAVAARAKRGKKGVLLAAPELWLLPSHASGRVASLEAQRMVPTAIADHRMALQDTAARLGRAVLGE